MIPKRFNFRIRPPADAGGHDGGGRRADGDGECTEHDEVQGHGWNPGFFYARYAFAFL